MAGSISVTRVARWLRQPTGRYGSVLATDGTSGASGAEQFVVASSARTGNMASD